jgi:hypothetical protein
MFFLPPRVNYPQFLLRRHDHYYLSSNMTNYWRTQGLVVALLVMGLGWVIDSGSELVAAAEVILAVETFF